MLNKFLITLIVIFTPMIAVAASAATAIKSPPDIIGGSILPGTKEDVKEIVESVEEEEGLKWIQEVLLKNVINKIIGWAAALTVVFLIIGGYQYLTNLGDDEQIKKAHKTIIWALAGLGLALLAFMIVQILININFG